MAYKDPNSAQAIEAMRVSRRKHYHANKEQYALRNKAKKELLRKILREAKDNPCVDCGVIYPFYVMQFDHIAGDKITDVSRLVASGSEKKLLEEIAKCELVCANCHAERTYLRQKNLID